MSMLLARDDKDFNPEVVGSFVEKFLKKPFTYDNTYLYLGIALGLIGLIICAFVFIYTLPYATLQKSFLTRRISSIILKKRFIWHIKKIEKKLHRKQIPLRDAYTQVDKWQRTYFRKATGLPFQNYNIKEIKASPLSEHADKFNLLYTGKYAPESDPAVKENFSHIKEFIQRWD